MKYVVCVPDGCADLPVRALEGKTPLEAAQTPVLDSLAARGWLGRARVIPDSLPPGSDVGNMSIFGYDPELYHTGRAPIEAAAMGIEVGSDQIAFRCNLVTIGDGAEGEIMENFAGGQPDSSLAARAIEALNAEITEPGFEFFSGVKYRNLMLAPREYQGTECVPPHDISEQSLVWPKEEGGLLTQMMLKSREVLKDIEGLEANQIWLWGQGAKPQMPSFESIYQKKAGLSTAVDLVRGLGVLTGMDVIEVEGATGWYDTNYEGKRDAALKALDDGRDLFIIHVEASDEAGHEGNVEEKVKSLENWDSRILADLVAGLDEAGDWRMLLLPDHATPLELMTHTPDPVPYLLVDSRENGPGGSYTEVGVKDLDAVDGHLLMGRLLSV